MTTIACCRSRTSGSLFRTAISAAVGWASRKAWKAAHAFSASFICKSSTGFLSILICRNELPFNTTPKRNLNPLSLRARFGGRSPVGLATSCDRGNTAQSFALSHFRSSTPSVPGCLDRRGCDAPPLGPRALVLVTRSCRVCSKVSGQVCRMWQPRSNDGRYTLIFNVKACPLMLETLRGLKLKP